MADYSQFLNETGTLEKMANKVTKEELEDCHYSKKSHPETPDEFLKDPNPLNSPVLSGKSFRSSTGNDDLNKTYTVVPDECQKVQNHSNSPVLSGKSFGKSTGSDDLNKTYTVAPDNCQKGQNHLNTAVLSGRSFRSSIDSSNGNKHEGNKNEYEGEKDGIKIIDTLSRTEIEERINTLLSIISLALSFLLLALILSVSIMLPKVPRIVQPRLTKLNGMFETVLLPSCLYLYLLNFNPSYWISCAICWNFDRKTVFLNNYHTYVRLQI